MVMSHWGVMVPNDCSLVITLLSSIEFYVLEIPRIQVNTTTYLIYFASIFSASSITKLDNTSIVSIAVSKSKTPAT